MLHKFMRWLGYELTDLAVVDTDTDAVFDFEADAVTYTVVNAVPYEDAVRDAVELAGAMR